MDPRRDLCGVDQARGMESIGARLGSLPHPPFIWTRRALYRDGASGRAGIADPDYMRICILHEGGDKAVQSDASLCEAIEGFAMNDYRLRDEILGFLRSPAPLT